MHLRVLQYYRGIPIRAILTIYMGTKVYWRKRRLGTDRDGSNGPDAAD